MLSLAQVYDTGVSKVSSEQVSPLIWFLKDRIVRFLYESKRAG